MLDRSHSWTQRGHRGVAQVLALRSDSAGMLFTNGETTRSLAAGSSNAPRRIQPACIAMQQKRNHHTRIERRLAEPTHIAAHDRLEIQALPHQPNDEIFPLGACPSNRCSNPSEFDSSLDYEQALSPLEYRSDAASAAECAGLRAEGPRLAVYRATNCPEYKVTAVQVTPSNGPTEWQEKYEELARKSRRIAATVEAAE